MNRIAPQQHSDVQQSHAERLHLYQKLHYLTAVASSHQNRWKMRKMRRTAAQQPEQI